MKFSIPLRLVALAGLLSMPGYAKTENPKPTVAAPVLNQLAIPPVETMVILIRSSLLALSQANQTNNYAVMNALGSESFRASNPPARLSETFASFRANNIDLAPVSLVNPIWTQQPVIADGKLRLIGSFPTRPMQVNFDLRYEPSVAGWKLFAITVNLNRTDAVAQPLPPGQR